jgi:hypothetical protein
MNNVAFNQRLRRRISRARRPGLAIGDRQDCQRPGD